MKKDTPFQKNFIQLVCTVGLTTILCATSTVAQVTSADWVIQKPIANRTATAIAKSHLSTKISLPAFYSKMENKEQLISIPNPDQSFDNFMIKPSETVDPSVAHLYTIKTFTGYKVNDPSVLIACDIDENGFHAAVYTNENTYFIEPQSKSGDHIIFYKRDKNGTPISCSMVDHDHGDSVLHRGVQTQATFQKRNYRLAIASSVEFSNQFGGSPYNTTNVLNALASGVNLIRPIYLRDLGVTFTLVTSANLVFTTKTFDTTDQDNILDNIHNKIVEVVGQNNFDIGHLVIWANLGGVAYKGVVCSPNAKGGGYSASDNSESTLWVDYVSHEIGHQFGSEHNFTSKECGTSANNFRFEPGEGSSIMSYANVCATEARYQSFSDPYFHYASIKQIHDYMATTSCATTSTSGNSSDPVANAQSDITIPKQTPFVLVGSATDANDPTNQLTYGWQQYDGSGSATNGSPNCATTNAALFRFRSPSSNNFRSFPQLTDVWAGNNNAMDWEKLPCAARTMNFSMTVRDNNTTFGRVTDDKMIVNVANTGPFEVTSPNTNITLTGGQNATITWSVNGTDAHCAKVDILLTTDAGQTYTILSDGTANDGTESVAIPNVNSQTARVLIQCDVTGNFKSASTFYDISNADFSIDPTLAIDEFENIGMTVYPNPANDFLTITTENNDQFSVNFLNLNGVVLIQKTLTGKTTIDTSSIDSGIYLLEITHTKTGAKSVKKIAIQ